MDNVKFAVYDFPCGRLKIGYTDKAIRYVRKTEEREGGTPSELSELAAKELSEYFAGERRSFDVPLDLQGTEFQRKVWQALSEIPYGETRSYREIAEGVGNPKACRAVGGANNKNPAVIIIPCHRVIGADGAMVGYGGGIEMKRLLLELERKNSG